MGELQSGLLGAGAEKHVRRAAIENARASQFFANQAKVKQVEYLSKRQNAGKLASAGISALAATGAKAVDGGLFDSVGDGAVPDSVGTGLRDTVSPGQLTMKDAPQSYTSKLRASQGISPRTNRGEGPGGLDMTLDDGGIMREAQLQRDIGGPAWSSQGFDPDRPFSSVTTAPSLRTQGHPSMGIAPMDTYAERSAVPGDFSIRAPDPGVGPEDFMSLPDISKTLDMRPRGVDPMQGALGRAGEKTVASADIEGVGDMTVNQLTEWIKDPEKQEALLKALRAQGGGQ